MLLKARLETGELGPALDAAGEVSDPVERGRQLRQIVDVQRSVGEFASALETARRIPESSERSEVRGAVVRDRSLSGGGNMANFGPLIELVTSTVQPESWEEVGGPGTVRQFRTGVHVDPHGLLRELSKTEQSDRLRGVSRRARVAELNDDLVRSSPLRMVSLKRLEREVSERLESGRPLPETLLRLAGLTQLRYVFAYPDEEDIVIAGPAEGWRYDELGRAVGKETGKLLLDLDDLVVVLRAFAPGGPNLFGCSINTRDDNLRQLKEFVEDSGQRGALRPGQLQSWLKDLRSRLGLQDIVVDGIPADTHVAQVIVEADYRMKLIGVEKLDGGPEIPSYFRLLKQSGQSRGAPLEALRWWLTMKYDAIVHSPDRLAFELEGSSVLVQSENQFVSAQGKHVPTGQAEPINRQFADNFTAHYQDLAVREPVFAALQNVFDMALVAALCREERLFDRVGWQPEAFADGGSYQPASLEVPKTIESVLNHRVYGGKDIVVQVAGGVQVDLAAMLSDVRLSRESVAPRDTARQAKIPAGRWWWDGQVE